MEYKTIHYSALLNLGDYNNERIGFTVQVEKDEIPEKIVEKLREKVKQIGGANASKMYQSLRDNESRLYDLNRKIKRATQEWERVADFLRAQGIKPDAPNMPLISNLLPEVQQEQAAVVEGEIEEEEDIADMPY